MSTDFCKPTFRVIVMGEMRYAVDELVASIQNGQGSMLGRVENGWRRLVQQGALFWASDKARPAVDHESCSAVLDSVRKTFDTFFDKSFSQIGLNDLLCRQSPGPCIGEIQRAQESLLRVVSVAGLVAALRETGPLDVWLTRTLDPLGRFESLPTFSTGDASIAVEDEVRNWLQKLCQQSSAEVDNGSQFASDVADAAVVVRLLLDRLMKADCRSRQITVPVLLKVGIPDRQPADGMAMLELEAVPGRGRLIPHPDMLLVFSDDWLSGFCEVWQSVVGDQFADQDVFWKLKTWKFFEVLDGQSAQAAFRCGLRCLAENRPWPRDVIVSAEVSHDLLDPVDGICDGDGQPGAKLQVVGDRTVPYRTVVVHENNAAELGDAARQTWEARTGKTLRSVRSLKELFDLLDEAVRQERGQLRVLVSLPEKLTWSYHQQTITDLLQRQRARYVGLTSIEFEFSTDAGEAHPKPHDFDLVIGVVQESLGEKKPVPETFYEHPRNRQPTFPRVKQVDAKDNQPTTQHQDRPRTVLEVELLTALRWMPARQELPLLFVHHQPEAGLDVSVMELAERDAAVARLDDLRSFNRELHMLGGDRVECPTIRGDRFEFRHQFEQSLSRLIQASLRAKGFSEQEVRDARPAATWQGNPFRGLERFEFEHAEVFHGRQTQVELIIRRLNQRAEDVAAEQSETATVVLVAGASGSGKSSLIRAGVIPALVNDRFATDERGRPVEYRAAVASLDLAAKDTSDVSDTFGRALSVARTLAAALVQTASTTVADGRIVSPQALPELTAGGDATIDSLARLILDNPSAAARRILTCLDRIEASQKTGSTIHEQCRLILCVDQFDELLSADLAKSRAAILELFSHLAQTGRVWVIGTLQSASLDALSSTDLHRYVGTSGLILLEPPRPQDWSEMIRGAAEAAGLTFEQHEDGRNLADLIVRDAHKSPDCLPLLQFAMDRLYQIDCGSVDESNTSPAPSRTLTFATYEKIGGVGGALAQEATRLEESLTPETRAELGKLFWHLVRLDLNHEEATLTSARRDAIDVSSGLNTFIDILIRERLLTLHRDGEGTSPQIRLTHFRLVESWPLLANWVSQTQHVLLLRERFEDDAKTWNREKRPDSLLLRREGDLQNGKDLLATGYQTGPIVHEFIAASETFSRSRRLALRAGLVVAAVLAAGFIIAISDYMKGRAQEALAVHELSLAYGQRTSEQRPAESKLSYLKARGSGEAAKLSPFRANLGLTGVLERSPEPVMWIPIQDEGTILALAISPNGERVLTAGGREGKPVVRVTDWVSGNRVQGFETGTPGIDAVCFSPDGRFALAGGRDHTIRIWDSHTGQLLRSLNFHKADITRLCVLFDSKTLVSGDDSGMIIVSDLQTGDIKAQNKISSSPILDIQPGEGSILAIATGNDTIELRDHLKLEVIRSFVASGNGSFLRVNWSRDGTQLIAASGDTFNIVVWNAQTGDLRRVFPSGHREVISTLAPGPIDEELLTSSWDGSIRLVNIADGTTRHLFMLPDKSSIQQAVLTPDGEWILAASLRSEIVAYRVPPINGFKRMTGHLTNVRDAAFSPDDRLVISAGADGSIRLFDPASHKQLCVVGTHEGYATCVNFVPGSDPLLAISGSVDRDAIIWDVFAQRKVAVFDHHTAPIVALDISPDGTTVATASEDGLVILWSARTQEPYATLSGHEGKVECVAFSNDGRLLATGGYDQRIRIWNAATGELIHHLPPHLSFVGAVSFHPDNRRLISTGMDRVVNVWDAKVGHNITGAPILDAAGTSLATSPDGALIAAADQTGIVRLLDANGLRDVWDSKAIANTGIHDMVTRVRFSHDGTKLLVAGHRGRLDVFDSNIGAAYVSCYFRLKEQLIRQEFKYDEAEMLARFASFHKLSRQTSPSAFDRLIGASTVDHLLGDWMEVTGAFGMAANRLAALVPNDNAIDPGRIAALFWRAGETSKAADFYDRAVSFGSLSPVMRSLIDEAMRREKAQDSLVIYRSDNPLSELSPTPSRRRITTHESQPRIIDADTGKVAYRVPFDTRTVGVRSLATDNEGGCILYRMPDGRLKCHFTHSGETTTSAQSDVHAGPVLLHPSNGFCVICTDDGRVQFRDLKTLTVQHELKAIDSNIIRAEFSADGSLLACGTSDGIVAIVDTVSHELIATGAGHNGAIAAFAFSSDMKLLATAGMDKTVRVWNSRTLAELETLNHPCCPQGIDFSSDGRLMVTAGTDCLIRVFSTGSWRLLRTVPAHDAHITSVRFGANDSFVLSSALDGRILKTLTLPEGIGTIDQLIKTAGNDGGSSAQLTLQIDLAPNSAEMFRTRGLAFWREGRVLSATHDFARFVQYANEHSAQTVEEKFVLATGLHALGERERAASVFTDLLELDPRVPTDISFKAHAALALRQWSRAQTFCEAAVVDPGSRPSFLYARAIVREINRDFAGAVSDLNELLGHFPAGKDRSRLLNLRAVCRVPYGKFDESLHDINEAIRLDPASSHGYFNKLSVLTLGGMRLRSRDELEWTQRRLNLGVAGMELSTDRNVPRVKSMSPWSAASSAGLLSGDQIVKFDAIQIETQSEFIRRVSECPSNHTATITFIRDNTEHTASLKLVSYRVKLRSGREQPK